MGTLRVLYTKRTYNIISLLIRWLIPRSRFFLALSSHVILVDGVYAIEAHMLYDVRRVLLEDALAGLTVVKIVDYIVPDADADAGIQWARNQVGKKYDLPGAFGLVKDPERNWQDPEAWFCFELIAGAIKAAGRNIFADAGHITEAVLLAINPKFE